MAGTVEVKGTDDEPQLASTKQRDDINRNCFSIGAAQLFTSTLGKDAKPSIVGSYNPKSIQKN
jgi:hypothetical protein